MKPSDQSRLFPAKIGQLGLMHTHLTDQRQTNSHGFREFAAYFD